MFGGGQPPEPKGDLHPLLDLIGIDWPTTEIVWNPYNPLQQLPELPPEVVFMRARERCGGRLQPEAIRVQAGCKRS